MERLAPVQEDAMTTEHHIALGKVNAYFGAPPSGPFSVWAHHPPFLEGAFQLFLAHRHEPGLERSLFELAIIIVARNWSAEFVWARHSPAALRTGIDEAVVAAVRAGQSPRFSNERERAAAAIIQELTWDRKVAQATFDEALRVLGSERLIALITAATFYAMVCNSTAAFETPLPDRLGTLDRLPPLADLPVRTRGAPSSGQGGRLTELDYDRLTRAQRIEVGKMRAHFGMDPRGPFQVWAHQPGVASGAFQLFQTAAFEGALERRSKEILTLTVARSWGCEYVWRSHAVQAANAGVAPDIIEAIRTGLPPRLSGDEEQIVHDVASELAGARRLSDATFRRAKELLGEAGLVVVVNCVSFLTMICMTIIAFDPIVPERADAPAPLLPLDGTV